MDPTPTTSQAAPKPVATPVAVAPENAPNPNRNNLIFAGVLIAYEILTLPIYGVLFRLNSHFLTTMDIGGILLMSMSAILLVVGFGLINAYITRYSFSGMTYTLLIFALTVQHFFLFRAFWNKAGANDYDLSTKSFSSWYNFVSLSNYGNDRQLTTLLPSGPFVQAIACAIAMNVAFSSLVGRIGLLELFFLTLVGTILYEVNAELIYRWFITDNGYGCRIFAFGSIVGLFATLILGKKQKSVNHQSYRSEYRTMAFSMLGFLFVCISLPSLSTITMFTRSQTDNAGIYAAQINAWLAVFSSVLGTFTASAFLYRKFSVFDLIFSGLAGAVSLAMEADICFNPCVPLIVGYVVGFACSIYPAGFHRKLNADGVIQSYPMINRYLIPSFFSSVVSAIIQACQVSGNGEYTSNMLAARTAIQQGGWQMVGYLITLATAAIAGVIIGVIIKLINNYQHQDQFNDEKTYFNIPNPMLSSD